MEKNYFDKYDDPEPTEAVETSAPSTLPDPLPDRSMVETYARLVADVNKSRVLKQFGADIKSEMFSTAPKAFDPSASLYEDYPTISEAIERSQAPHIPSTAEAIAGQTGGSLARGVGGGIGNIGGFLDFMGMGPGDLDIARSDIPSGRLGTTRYGEGKVAETLIQKPAAAAAPVVRQFGDEMVKAQSKPPVETYKTIVQSAQTGQYSKAAEEAAAYIWDGAVSGAGSSLPIYAASVAGTPGVVLSSWAMGLGEMQNTIRDEKDKLISQAFQAKSLGLDIAAERLKQAADKMDPKLHRQTIIAAGTAIGLLDAVVPIGVLGSATQAHEIKALTSRYLVRLIVAAQLADAGKEGLTEGFQESAKIVGVAQTEGARSALQYVQALNDKLDQIIDSALQGASAGLLFGTVHGVREARSARQQAQSKSPLMDPAKQQVAAGEPNVFDKYDEPAPPTPTPPPEAALEEPAPEASPVPVPDPGPIEFPDLEQRRQELSQRDTELANRLAEIETEMGSLQRDSYVAGQMSDAERQAQAAQQLDFEDIRSALPLDENGDPNVAALTSELERFGRKSWQDLSPSEAYEVASKLAPQTLARMMEESAVDTGRLAALTREVEQLRGERQALLKERGGLRQQADQAREKARVQQIEQKAATAIQTGGLTRSRLQALGVPQAEIDKAMAPKVKAGEVRKVEWSGEYWKNPGLPGESPRATDIRNEISRLAQEMAPILPKGTKIKSFAELKDIPQFANTLKDQDGKVVSRASGNVIDAFQQDDVIYLAAYAVKQRGRIAHEGLHVLVQAGVVKPEELSLLAERGRKTGAFPAEMEARYRADYSARFPASEVQRRLDEEAAAHLIEARVNGKDLGKRVNSIIDRIVEFLERLGNVLRFKGFQTANDVAEAFLTGEMANRVHPAELTGPVGRYPSVDDAMMAMGSPDRPVTPGLDMSLEARKKRAEEMGFDTSRVYFKGHYPYESDALKRGLAGFFTPDKDVANRFAGFDEHAVAPVYLKFSNPLVIDAEGNWAAAIQFDSIAKRDGTMEKLDQYNTAFDKGHDAIIIKNTKDEGDIVVIPTMQQVRSINAAFDPANGDSPNLMFAMGDLAARNGAALIDDIGPNDPHPGRVLVFHGTGSNVEKFDASKGEGFGVHVGTSGQGNTIASFRSREGQIPTNVMPMVLDTERVIDLQDVGDWRPDVVARDVEAAMPQARGLENEVKIAMRAEAMPAKDAFDKFTQEMVATYGNIPVDQTPPEVQTKYAELKAAESLERRTADRAKQSAMSPSERAAKDMLGKQFLRQRLVDLGIDAIRYRNRIEGAGWSYVVLREGTLTSATTGQPMFAFAGPRAKTADLEALSRAKQMMEEGSSREDIWTETGWFRGKDGKWRWEIDDSGADLLRRGDLQGFMGMPWRGPETRDLSATIRHDAMFDAYPDLPTSNLTLDPDLPGGASYNRGTKGFSLNPPSGDGRYFLGEFQRSALLHEMQHAAQHREGFQGGGSLQGEEARIYNEYAARINDALQSGNTEEAARLRAERTALNLKDDTDTYRRLAGEVEARAVQKRMNMTPEERRARPPWLDYDVPESEQIVRFSNPDSVSQKSYSSEPPIEGFPTLKDGPMFAIRAYHGSPHDFDKFSMEHIGKGEGAQAYGFGLYFAESEGVARHYRTALSGDDRYRADGKRMDPFNVPADHAALRLAGNQGNRKEAIRLYDEEIATLREQNTGTRFLSSERSKLNKRIALLEQARASVADGTESEIAATGRLYEVSINASPEDFLDWDKPLSQQSEKVYKALNDAYRGRGGQADLIPDKLGWNAIDIAFNGDRERAAAALREAGIPGIKYLDQMSRGQGEGTSNYVIFDDSLITITAKDGKPVEPQEVSDLKAAMSGGQEPMFAMGDADRRPEVKSLQSIVSDLARDLGLTIRQGLSRTAMGRAASRAGLGGVYDPATGVIRVRSMADANAVARAAGGAIQHRIGQPLEDVIAAHADELLLPAAPTAPAPTLAPNGYSGLALSRAMQAQVRDAALLLARSSALAANNQMEPAAKVQAEAQRALSGLRRRLGDATASAVIKDTLGGLKSISSTDAMSLLTVGDMADVFNSSTRVRARLEGMPQLPREAKAFILEGRTAEDMRFRARAVALEAMDPEQVRKALVAFGQTQRSAGDLARMLDALGMRERTDLMGDGSLAATQATEAYVRKLYSDIIVRQFEPSALPTMLDVSMFQPDAKAVEARIAERFTGPAPVPDEAPLTPSKAELDAAFQRWFGLYLVNPTAADAEAPFLREAMEQTIEKADDVLLAKIHDSQNAIFAYHSANPMEAHEASVKEAGSPKGWDKFWSDAQNLGAGSTPFQRMTSGFKAALSTRMSNFYRDTMDAGHPYYTWVWDVLHAIEQKTGRKIDIDANQNPYKLLRLLPFAHAHAHADLDKGVLNYLTREHEGPSYHDVIQRALGPDAGSTDIGPGSRYHKFSRYLVARYGVTEWARYRDGLKDLAPMKMPQGAATPQQAIDVNAKLKAEYEAQFPEFVEAAAMLAEYQRNLLKAKRDAGVIEPELYDALIKDTDYVPLYRVFDETEAASTRALGAVGPAAVLKRKRGSERDIYDPLASIVQKTFETRALIAKNDIMRATISLAEAAGPAGGAFAERISPTQISAMGIDVQRLLESAAKEAGVDTQSKAEMIDVAHEILGEDAFANYFVTRTIQPGKQHIQFFYENGKLQAMQLGDGGRGHELTAKMMEALNTFGKTNLDLMIKVMSLPAQMIRMGVTTHPTFMLANPIRDANTAWKYDRNAYPVWTQIKGVIDIATGAEHVDLYRSHAAMMGGEATSYAANFIADRNMKALMERGARMRAFADLPSALVAVGQALKDAGAGATMLTGALAGATAGSAGGLFGSLGGFYLGAVGTGAALNKMGLGQNAGDKAVGLTVGALTGASLGGPVGAVIGGVLGATAGGRTLAKIGEISEEATRTQLFRLEYERQLARGKSKLTALTEAAFWAHDYTDYSRRGDKMKGLAATIPFLNANLQGNDSSIRRWLGKEDQSYVGNVLWKYPAYKLGWIDATNMTDRQKRALEDSAWAWFNTVLVMGGITAALALMYQDDEEINAIDSRVRATHWLFKVPVNDVTLAGVKVVDHYIARVTKPFEMVWFSQFIERLIMNAAKGDPRWYERYAEDLYNIWSPPIIPSIAEVLGTAAGLDISNNRQIVPQHIKMQDKARPQQFDAYTSEFAKWAGKELDTAPLYVDHLMQKFGASWGRTFTELNMPGLPWYNPQRPMQGLEEDMIARRFLWKAGKGTEDGQAFRQIMGAEDPILLIGNRFAQAASKLAVAGTTFRSQYIEKPTPDLSGGIDYLKTLTPAERGYAILEAYYKGSSAGMYRMLHPMNRAEEIDKISRTIQKEIISGELLSGRKGSKAGQKELPMTPAEKAAARDVLTRLAASEIHNALVLTGEKGFAHRGFMDTKADLEILRLAVPTAYKELMARFDKQHVLPWAGIQETWPKVKERSEDPRWVDWVRTNRVAQTRFMFADLYERAKAGRLGGFSRPQSSQPTAVPMPAN